VTDAAARREEAALFELGSGAALGRSGIREIMDLAASLDGVLHLEIGEPDFPTPPHVVEAAQRALAGGDVKYTLCGGLPTLRDVIAEKLRSRNGVDVTGRRVVVTAGGIAAIFEALLVLLRPGDGVLIPDPGWPVFELAASLQHARVLRYRLARDGGFLPDMDELESRARDARVLVVNSPSNPTGAVYERATLEALYELARRHDLAIVSDEVYEDIVFEAEHLSLSSLDEDGRVVSIFSLSKSYAMTGWRIGYATAAAAVVEAMVRVQEPVLACPSWIGQKAAEAALTGPQDVLAERCDQYRLRRDAVIALLRQHGLFVAEPRGTFYAFADVSPLGRDTYEVARRLLVEERVAVAPGETFGPAGAGLVRLSLAGAPDTLTEAVTRIARAVERAGRR
jgi:aspartate/methionine/tyrosine aminotransferase